MLKGTNVASYGATPTHSANGVTFNGTDNYLNTGWKPSISANYSQDSARLVIVIPTSSGSAAALNNFVGCVSTTGSTFRTGLEVNSTTAVQIVGINNADGFGAFTASSDQRGVFIGTRTASAAQKIYFWQHTAPVGAAVTSSATGAGASTGVPSQNMSIGGRTFEGFPVDRFAAYTCSGFESGAKCDDTQATAIRDAWAQLQADLGR